MRDVAGELIKALEHAVEFAAHGKETIDKYQRALRSGKPFVIVILDLTIRGGTGGAETLQKIGEIYPGVKAVVSSGYSDDLIPQSTKNGDSKHFLRNPIMLEIWMM